jgi:L-fuconolactonase
MKDLITDAHQHFWQLGRFEFFWMTPERQALRRDFLPSDLQPLLRRLGIDRSVVVQTHASHAESLWLLELASAHDFLAGVVAWTDLTSTGLGRVLDEFQRHPKFKGIRHPLEAEPDDSWVVKPSVIEGLRELERRDIPFDLVIFPRHLKYITEVRRCCPKLRLVIDHLAKPAIASGEFESWAREVENVAHLPEVWCKLSGMVTEANQQNWKPEDLKPYVDHVVRQFGYERVIFGSDWPVCVLAASYEQVVYALRYALGPLQEIEAARVWGRNAAAYYNL